MNTTQEDILAMEHLERIRAKRNAKQLAIEQDEFECDATGFLKRKIDSQNKRIEYLEDHIWTLHKICEKLSNEKIPI